MPTFKDIPFRLDHNTFHPTVPAYLQRLAGTQTLELELVLKSIAWNTRPLLLPVGGHLTWALSRYLILFQRGSDLRLIPEWAHVDPHQKTILSDDIGVGATTHLLESRAGFQFVQTSYVIRHGRPIRPVATPSRRQAADFIGTRTKRHRIALECKGTQGSRSALARFLTRGRTQKRSTRTQFRGKLRYGLVAGIFAPPHDSTEHALIRFQDPPVSPDVLQLGNLSDDELDFRIFCGTLAGQLYAAGAEHTGLHVATRIETKIGPLARQELERLVEPREIFRLSRCIPSLPDASDVSVTASIRHTLIKALLSDDPLAAAQSLKQSSWEYPSTDLTSATITPHGIKLTISAFT